MLHRSLITQKEKNVLLHKWFCPFPPGTYYKPEMRVLSSLHLAFPDLQITSLKCADEFVECRAVLFYISFWHINQLIF